MLVVLDDPPLKGNVWAMIAALISLAHGAATRTNEPTHALLKDVTISDEGIYMLAADSKTHKGISDDRLQTLRASAHPGSAACPVTRLRAYIGAAKLGGDDLLFPHRDAMSGDVVRDRSGAAARFTDYFYTRDFRAIAQAAGIANALKLSPRGLRAGGAMDKVLAGSARSDVRAGAGGWSEESVKLYVLANVIGHEVAAMARARSAAFARLAAAPSAGAVIRSRTTRQTTRA